jgi:hypothetical protein
MKKILMASFALTVFAVAIILFQISSCKKADAGTPLPCEPLPVCSVVGIYSGTYTNQNNFTGTFASRIEENNFAEVVKQLVPLRPLLVVIGILVIVSNLNHGTLSIVVITILKVNFQITEQQ